MKFSIKTASSIMAVALMAMAILATQAMGKSGNDDGHQNRGKVSSFENGILTIKRSSGSTVSGKVSSSTKIRCRNRSSSSSARTSRNGADDGPNHDAGDDKGGSGQSGNDDSSGGSKQSGSAWHACSKSNLVVGARIHEASFRATSANRTFHEVKITK